MPVSYTHLDVYKRQYVINAAALYCDELADTVGKKYFRNYPRTVSYTHLDVYKRQGSHRGIRLFFVRVENSLCKRLEERAGI